MIHRKKVKRDIYDYDYIGVVEDISDPLRLGRARVRIEALHGRKTDKKFIPTEHLPWYEPSSRGFCFSTEALGKVVYVAFESDDYYKGSFFAVEHYNINLQKKLESYNDADYADFYAMNFDADHQYYYEPHKGLIFDYKKSYIKISDDADISICLKDNSSTMYLGSENASQSLMLGDNWMNWFDTLIQTLQTMSFIGNLGAPVMPSPNLIAVLQQYQTLRSNFLSKHIFAANNNSIRANNRNYDNPQSNDNFKTEETINNTKGAEPVPQKKKKVGEEGKDKPTTEPETKVPKTLEGVTNPQTPVMKIPANNAEKHMLSTSKRTNMDDVEKLKFVNPTSVENGKHDISTLRISKYLQYNYSAGDERMYLLSELATNLDNMLDDFEKIRLTGNYSKVIATKGYVNFERQTDSNKLNATYPAPGTDPFGYANQIELTIDKNSDIYPNIDDVYTDYFNGKMNTTVPQMNTFDWLIKNGPKYNIVLAGNYASNNSFQYWHFIYKASEKAIEKKPVEREKTGVIKDDGLNKFPMENSSGVVVYNITDIDYNKKENSDKIPNFRKISIRDNSNKKISFNSIGFITIKDTWGSTVKYNSSGGYWNPFNAIGINGLGSSADDTKFTEFTNILVVASGTYKMEVEYYPNKENGDYTKEILIVDITVPKSLSTKQIGQKARSKYIKMIERYVDDYHISFFTELMSDIDDDFEGTTYIYEYASDYQLQRRKTYLSKRITIIEEIPNWETKPASVIGFETLKEEHNRYKTEYDQIQQYVDNINK